MDIDLLDITKATSYILPSDKSPYAGRVLRADFALSNMYP
jgi:ubiquitin-protein ligase